MFPTRSRASRPAAALARRSLSQAERCETLRDRAGSGRANSPAGRRWAGRAGASGRATTGLVAQGVLVVLTVVAGACGGDDDAVAPPRSGGGPEGPATTEEAAAFPVTIEHKYGSITIEAEPDRVVSVGFADQDTILALGVAPVGVREWYGEQPFATWPWAQDELGDAEPEVLAGSELNIEAVAALDPDLIVGISSGMTEEQYGLLSAIAPTLAQPGEFPDYGTPWRDATHMVGRALGRSSEAEAIIGELDQRIAAARTEVAAPAGATAAVAFVFDGQPGAYASADIRSRFLTDLGFTIPPEYDELAGDQFFITFSAEQLSYLDVDLLVWISGDEMTRAAIDQLPGRSSLRAARDGRELFADEELSGAFSFSSPLSLPYLIDELVPLISNAMAGENDKAAVTTTAAGTATSAAGSTAALDDDQRAVATAYETVFDSSTPLEAKRPFLPDADALAPTITAYGETGARMGGIGMDVTAVDITADIATVTYDVRFGRTQAYGGLTGTLQRVDGAWTVSRDEFCSFMSSARTPCS